MGREVVEVRARAVTEAVSNCGKHAFFDSFNLKVSIQYSNPGSHGKLVGLMRRFI